MKRSIAENIVTSSVIACAILAFSTSACFAATVYNNLGIADSYGSTGSTFGFGGSQLAYSFTAPTSFYLDSIVVAVRGNTGGTTIGVHLASNLSGGLEPDSLLESSSVYTFGNPTLRAAAFSGSTLVNASAIYWVLLECLSGCVADSTWFDNNTSALSDQATRAPSSGSWQVLNSVTQGALRISATVVPLPPAFWLFGSALLGFAGFSRQCSVS